MVHLEVSKVSLPSDIRSPEVIQTKKSSSGKRIHRDFSDEEEQPQRIQWDSTSTTPKSASKSTVSSEKKASNVYSPRQIPPKVSPKTVKSAPRSYHETSPPLSTFVSSTPRRYFFRIPTNLRFAKRFFLVLGFVLVPFGIIERGALPIICFFCFVAYFWIKAKIDVIARREASRLKRVRRSGVHENDIFVDPTVQDAYRNL